MANWESWVSVFRFVIGFCVVGAILEGNIFVVADDISSVGRAENNAQVSEICNTDMNSFLPPPFTNLSGMTCTTLWNTFVMKYSQDKENVVNIVLSAVYTTGWIGMGFSKDGSMVGSSAMVGWINKKGEARIKQYYLQGYESSKVIPEKGELPLTGIPSSVALHGARIYLAFQLKFPTRLARQPLILALGSAHPNAHFHLSIHDDRTVVKFDFSAGSAASASSSGSGSNIGQKKKNHGILGILGWGLFLPIGAIVPRYFKHKDPLWYYLHIVIQFVGFILGLATVVLGKQLYDDMGADQPTHRGIGIFVLFLSILQVLAFFLRPNKDAKIRMYWNWYHHWCGRVALFFAALNITIGINIGHAGNDWKIGYGFLLAVVLLSVIILEALKCMKRRSDSDTMPSSFQMNPIQ